MTDRFNGRRILGGTPNLAISIGTEIFMSHVLAQGGPIKFGFLGPLNGVKEILHAPTLTDAHIAAHQINAAGGVIGRKIEPAKPARLLSSGLSK